MATSRHLDAMKKALEQLKLNQRNLRKGMSASIQKLQARENEEAIQDLSRSISEIEAGVEDDPRQAPATSIQAIQ